MITEWFMHFKVASDLSVWRNHRSWVRWGHLDDESTGNLQYFRGMCGQDVTCGIKPKQTPSWVKQGPSPRPLHPHPPPTCHMLVSASIWKSLVWRTLFAYPGTPLTLEPGLGHQFPARAENQTWSCPDLPRPLSVSAALLASWWAVAPLHPSPAAQLLLITCGSWFVPLLVMTIQLVVAKQTELTF